MDMDRSIRHWTHTQKPKDASRIYSFVYMGWVGGKPVQGREGYYQVPRMYYAIEQNSSTTTVPAAELGNIAGNGVKLCEKATLAPARGPGIGVGVIGTGTTLGGGKYWIKDAFDSLQYATSCSRPRVTRFVQRRRETREGQLFALCFVWKLCGSSMVGRLYCKLAYSHVHPSLLGTVVEHEGGRGPGQKSVAILNSGSIWCSGASDYLETALIDNSIPGGPIWTHQRLSFTPA